MNHVELLTRIAVGTLLSGSLGNKKVLELLESQPGVRRVRIEPIT